MIEQRTKTIERNTETIERDTKMIERNTEAIERDTKTIERDTKTILTDGTLVTGMERSLTISSRRHCNTPVTDGRIRLIISPHSLHARNAHGRPRDGLELGQQGLVEQADILAL